MAAPGMYAPNRAVPEMEAAPKSMRHHHEKIIVERARELLKSGVDGNNSIPVSALPQWDRLKEAVANLDIVEGKKA